MIEVKEVSKNFKIKKGHGFLGSLFSKYQSFSALNKVSFSVNKGEILGLLGPNGSGKSTLIKIITGLLQPSSGSVTINGKPPEKQKQLIGLVLGPNLLYHRLTGYDNLEYYGKLYSVQDIDSKIHKLSRFFGIKDWLDEYVEHYSEGMKTKLTLARALLHNPELLVLDEPTTGLDVKTSNDIRKRISALGTTVILTTHDIEEAKELSDRIIILRKGKVANILNNPKETDVKEAILNESK